MSARRPGSRARATPGDGGVPARRAVIRWGWRLFRHEWRQQLLVLTLLTVAVAAAIGGASAAYTLAPVPVAAQYGTTNQAFEFDGSDPRELDDNLGAVQEWFDTIDAIGRRNVPVPGSAQIIELRAQDPQGTYGAAMLALLDGRYPTGAGEIALTASLLETFDVDLNASFFLDGARRTVVGVVENPGNLNDDFALVAPAHADPPHQVTVLVRGDPKEVFGVAANLDGGWGYGSSSGPEPVLAAAAALAAAAVAMVLVALVAAAAFLVTAQRRRRQLGMLAAIGATQQHLRLVLLANGAAVGIVAAAVGAILGLLGWIALVPYLEEAVAARIDRFDVLPWWLIGTAMLLTVAAGTAAAWWPARAAARIPVTHALSDRPSPPKPVRGSALLAGLFLVGGAGCLTAADVAATGWAKGLLVGTGAVATVLGILFLSPSAVRAVGAGVEWAPVAVRLALRDLARYQSRAAAALAAISLAMGIAVTVIVTTAAAERTDEGDNLSPSQLLVTREGGRIREVVTVGEGADMDGRRPSVDGIASLLDDPAVLPLYQAVDPDQEPHPGRGGMLYAYRDVALIGDGEQTVDPAPLFVATPEILEHYGVDPDPATDVLTAREGEVGLRYLIHEELVTNVERLDVPAHSSAPTSFITLDGLRRRGWEPAPAGWFIEASSPISDRQISEAREMAARADLMVEHRNVAVNVAALRSLRIGGMAGGMLVAFAVLAMTVGLIRCEAARDLRILAALGATGATRRTLTAATAGALALLGVVLGTIGAYAGLAAGFASELGALSPVPVLHLIIVAVGVPLVAAITGWLLAGRQPPALARQAFE